MAELESVIAKEVGQLTVETAADKLRWLSLQGPMAAAKRLMVPVAEPRHVGQLAPALRDGLDDVARDHVSTCAGRTTGRVGAGRRR